MMPLVAALLLYIFLGAVLLALVAYLTRPHDVTLGELLAAPVAVVLWPALMVFWFLETDLAEKHLFTIGKRNGKDANDERNSSRS